MDHECTAEEEIVTRLTVQEQNCWTEVIRLEEKRKESQNHRIIEW